MVIFYGRLAPDLPDNLRTKHALPAFVKALEDKVPLRAHGRRAGTRCVSRRIRSGVCCSTRRAETRCRASALDPAKPVRDAAVPCLEAYLAVVRKAAEEMTRQEKLRAKQEAAKRQAETPQKAPRQQAPPPPKQEAPPPPPEPTSPSAGWGLASWAGAAASNALGKVASAASEAAAGLASAEDVTEEAPAPPPKKSIDDDGDGWGDDDAWGAVPTKKVEPKKASPKKPAARKVSPRKAPPPKDDFFDSWGDDQPAKPSRVAAAAAEDEDDDDPWGTKEPVPVAKKPSVEDRRAQRRAELEASGKLEPRRARSKPSITKAAPPAPPADDGWGDDAWGDDVPAKPVALKSSPKKPGRKTLPKKTGTLSLSKGMFSKDQKAAPPPKAKTEEQIKAEKLKAAAAARTPRPVSKLRRTSAGRLFIRGGGYELPVFLFRRTAPGEVQKKRDCE